MSRAPRLPHHQYTGVQRYFLTTCTHERREFFRDGAAVSQARDQFFYTARKEMIAILAYCFMPDHLHLLADGETERADLRLFAKLSKQRSGYRFKKLRGATL